MSEQKPPAKKRRGRPPLPPEVREENRRASRAKHRSKDLARRRAKREEARAERLANPAPTSTPLKVRGSDGQEAWNLDMILDILERRILDNPGHYASVKQAAAEPYIDETGNGWPLPSSSRMYDALRARGCDEQRERWQRLQLQVLEDLYDVGVETLADEDGDMKELSGKLFANTARPQRAEKLIKAAGWKLERLDERYQNRRKVELGGELTFASQALRQHIENNERGKLPVEVLREQGSLPLIQVADIDGD